MPRNISFAMTIEQIKARTKTITRRFGWLHAKVGDVYQGVEKGMGLKEGEKIVKLAKVRVTAVRREPLNAITQEDVIAEGFPDWTPEQFVDFLVGHYRCDPSKECTVITFEYVWHCEICDKHHDEIVMFCPESEGPYCNTCEQHFKYRCDCDE